MEKKKRYYPPREGKGEDAANGQRISVRPGNFTPPGAPATPKKENAPASAARKEAPQSGNAPAHAGQGGRNRNRHRRGHGGGQNQGQKPQQERREEQARPQQEQVKQPQGNRGNVAPRQQQKQPQQGAQREQQKQPQQNAQREQAKQPQQGGRSRRDRRRGGHHEERRAQQMPQAPALSESLQRELDEEFSTPMLDLHTPLSRTEKKASVAEAVDSEEFAVDIATASYLVEDIPCGFPIPDGKAVEVIGVRFRCAGRIYFFAPAGFKFAIGDRAIVDTARGPEIGDVVMLNRKIAEKDIVQPLRAVLRPATPEDEAQDAQNHEKEAQALKVCAEKIAQHKLDMRLVDAQYTFDNSKLLFYFTSEGRVDFRELVRDLAGYFRTRIELRQIGIRDESRLIGGLGMCGRPFCCATFLSDFGQVSVKMAKDQGLSINASKISGCCGRLMCCLRYEHETYVAEAKLTPKKDAVVETPEGRGVVVDSTPLLGMLKVKLDALPEEPPRVYHRDDVKPLSRATARNAEDKPAEPQKSGDGRETAENS